MLRTLWTYFDDSGTHAGSSVAVIGGLIGTKAQWESFEQAWAAKLARPLPHKPPLKMFHLSHCNAGKGEFADYNDAERDWVTREFRDILIANKLIGVAACIEVKAWHELVPTALPNLGEPLGHCAEMCVTEALKTAIPHPEGDAVGVVFDRGIYSDGLKAMLDPLTYHLGRPRVTHIGWSPVDLCLPLQGADIVATENYWHASAILKVGDDAAVPRPHMRHYLDNMYHEGFILDRAGISSMLKDAGA